MSEEKSGFIIGISGTHILAYVPPLAFFVSRPGLMQMQLSTLYKTRERERTNDIRLNTHTQPSLVPSPTHNPSVCILHTRLDIRVRGTLTDKLSIFCSFH